MCFGKLTSASNCARPATRDEMTRGRMSILSILIKISPGKEINMIVSSVNSPYLRTPPMINPPMTPTIVRTNSKFSPIHPPLAWMKGAKNRREEKEGGDDCGEVCTRNLISMWCDLIVFWNKMMSKDLIYGMGNEKFFHEQTYMLIGDRTQPCRCLNTIPFIRSAGHSWSFLSPEVLALIALVSRSLLHSFSTSWLCPSSVTCKERNEGTNEWDRVRREVLSPLTFCSFPSAAPLPPSYIHATSSIQFFWSCPCEAKLLNEWAAGKPAVGVTHVVWLLSSCQVPGTKGEEEMKRRRRMQNEWRKGNEFE